jgi:UPF0716 protein FxsA
MNAPVGSIVRGRLRLFVGLSALAELVVFAVVASWIGIGWTILATLATSALGGLLLARQGVRALRELRDRARARQPAGRELGNAGLVAVGGLLMLLPGFLGDLLGLLCLLPGTRGLIRAALIRTVYARLPDRMRGPVRVDSARAERTDGGDTPLVIEGEIVRPDDGPGR